MNNYVFYFRGMREKYYKNLVPWSIQMFALATVYGDELTINNCFADEIKPMKERKETEKEAKRYFEFEKMLLLLKENPCKTHICAFSREIFPNGIETENELLKQGYTICYVNQRISAMKTEEINDES